MGCRRTTSRPEGRRACGRARSRVSVRSCAPEFFRIRDVKTLAVLVSPVPGTEGFGFASAMVTLFKGQ